MSLIIGVDYGKEKSSIVYRCRFCNFACLDEETDLQHWKDIHKKKSVRG